MVSAPVGVSTVFYQSESNGVLSEVGGYCTKSGIGAPKQTLTRRYGAGSLQIDIGAWRSW